MKRYLAESISTFCLLFCGTGAIVINEVTGGTIGHLGIALSFGLIVTIMIYTFGNISGTHMNPAVSFVCFVQKEMPFTEFAKYVLVQVIGAILASVLLKMLFPYSVSLGATIPSGSALQSFVLEIFLAFMLMLVIERIKSNKQLAGILIGGVVGLEALFAGPICGASMNPIRSLAPALVSGHFDSLWIYLTAPFIGMYLGSITSRFISSQ
jgi:aquaporin NIP